jgi:hypothetical protein
MVFRLSYALLTTLVLLSGCRDKLQTKEKVQEAVLDRLKTHSGLDLAQLDVTTTDVIFEKNKATATVAFHPKGDASVNGGMTMKYNLEEQDGKWVVTGVKSGNGSAMPGHPPLTGASDGMGQSPLPPGQPSISEPMKQ